MGKEYFKKVWGVSHIGFRKKALQLLKAKRSISMFKKELVSLLIFQILRNLLSVQPKTSSFN